jgi:hypothetical protein
MPAAMHLGHGGCSLPNEEDAMEDERKQAGQAGPEESVEGGENEGEGSKSADRAYRRDVDEFLRENDPSKLARQAASDIERDPETYEEAEKEGKRRSAGDDPADEDLI